MRFAGSLDRVHRNNGRPQEGALVFLLCLVLFACEMPSLQSTPTPPPATPTQASVPPPPPPEQAQPVALRAREQVQVVVYEDASPQADTCFDLLPHMPPASAFGMFEAKTVPCTVGFAELTRLQLVEAANGVLYLRKILLLLTPTPDLPDVHSRFCEEIVQYLLPASADPAGRGRLTCWSEPPVRGHEHTNVIKIWGWVPVEPPVGQLPEDIHCWELTRLLGPATERQTVPQACILN